MIQQQRWLAVESTSTAYHTTRRRHGAANDNLNVQQLRVAGTAPQQANHRPGCCKICRTVPLVLVLNEMFSTVCAKYDMNSIVLAIKLWVSVGYYG